MTSEPTPNAVRRIAETMGIDAGVLHDGDMEVRSPIDGSVIASVATTDASELDRALDKARNAFVRWRDVPAPRRGEVVRLLGEELRKHKESLGELVTLEVGKVTSEGKGEVQEMIDVCDFAVGLSRQLYGTKMTRERALHLPREQWPPTGP